MEFESLVTEKYYIVSHCFEEPGLLKHGDILVDKIWEFYMFSKNIVTCGKSSFLRHYVQHDKCSFINYFLITVDFQYFILVSGVNNSYIKLQTERSIIILANFLFLHGYLASRKTVQF